MNKLLILLFPFVLPTALYSQNPDPVLFEGTWYLTELVVDGTMIDIPDTKEISEVELDITSDELFSTVCNILVGGISDFTDVSFAFDVSGILVNDCFLQSTFDFELSYLGHFFDRQVDMEDNFTYTLETGPNDAITLTIMNAEGDTAVYGNSALGIDESQSIMFELYPNPVTEKLFIQLSQNTEVEAGRLYDVQGRLINQQEPTQTPLIEIDTTSLEAGLYFVQVIDTIGNVEVQQFVKK